MAFTVAAAKAELEPIVASYATKRNADISLDIDFTEYALTLVARKNVGDLHTYEAAEISWAELQDTPDYDWPSLALGKLAILCSRNLADANDGKGVTPERLKGLRNLLLPRLYYIFRTDGFEADIAIDLPRRCLLVKGYSFKAKRSLGFAVTADRIISGAWEATFSAEVASLLRELEHLPSMGV